MSGTSADGIDAALIQSDGEAHVTSIAHYHVPYDADFRQHLLGCLNYDHDPDGSIAAVERALTDKHAGIVHALLTRTGYSARSVDLIGFHGHTIFHDPDNRVTWQIGDGARLAELTGIDVINDFRSHDVQNGGQGAPLLPAYHRALLQNAGLELPVVIQNIGGVGNVTYIGKHEREMLAFDTGPGNALIDDWVYKHTGQSHDNDGALAEHGRVHEALIQKWLTHPYFRRQPPKSLDRNAWDVTDDLAELCVEDGAATLSAFTIRSIGAATQHFPEPAQNWYIAGGGRHNSHIMQGLAKQLGAPVTSADQLGWHGDFIEAEGFAFLAARAKSGYPLSWPGTTGVTTPLTGGYYHNAKCSPYT
jgi:anhydro-N-acetylmuramic acid kinase